MARTAPTTEAATVVGLNPVTFSAPDATGDSLDPGCILLVQNDSGGAITVTVQTPGDVEGLAVAENIVSVGAGAMAAINLDARTYERPVSAGTDVGKVYVDYSAVASVTRAVIAAS